MSEEQFDRINELSEVVATKQASIKELDEFHELLKLWNENVEQNIISKLDSSF